MFFDVARPPRTTRLPGTVAWMRHLLTLKAFVLLVACGGGSTNEPPPSSPSPVASASASTETKKPDEPAIASKKGPAGFPLPLDAEDAGAAPGGGGKIVIFKVGRPSDAVIAEVKTLAQKDGWKLDSEEKSPKGATRWMWSKDGTIVGTRLVGDGAQTAIIVTAP